MCCCSTSDVKATEEMSENKKTVCNTLAIDCSGQDIMNRLSTEVYNRCRSGRLSLPTFPNFSPALEALKAGAATEPRKPYKVCAQVQDKLLILQSLAQKWLSEEATQQRAQDLVENHNQEFNQGGDFLMPEKTLAFLTVVLLWL